MLNNMKKTALAALIIASGINAAAAESVQVKVVGTIVPAACTPSVGGGGIIDYGNIKADILKADDYTLLPEMEQDFTITCDAPARIALHAVNDRPGTLAGGKEAATGVGPAPIRIFDYPSVGVVGLGLDGTTPIGGYSVKITAGKVMADDVAVDSLYDITSTNGTGTWKLATFGGVYNNVPNCITWGAAGTTTPVAFRNLTGKLAVQAYINKASELDLSHAIHLDGQTTLEVVYL